MSQRGGLGQLCSLQLAHCPPSGSATNAFSTSLAAGKPWHATEVVEKALWDMARRCRAEDLVEGGGVGGAGAGTKGGTKGVNVFDCLYAFFMSRGWCVKAAKAQDELRKM